MLSAKGSNVDQGYWTIIESEYEINGLPFNINGNFNFWMNFLILRKAFMDGSTTYIALN